MNRFKKFPGGLSTFLPLNFLLKTSGIKTLLPYQHVVSNERLPHIEELYAYKNEKQFIKDLDWLLRHFKPVHPSEIATAVLNDRPLPHQSFLLSFDDGFREVHDVIAPILFEKGVPAIFFINPSFIDSKELFYRCKLGLVLNKVKRDSSLLEKISLQFPGAPPDYSSIRQRILSIGYNHRGEADVLGRICEIDFEDFLRRRQPFLNMEQIGRLQHKGFVFGGHSMDHPHYRLLSQEQQLQQTVDSVSFVRSFQPEGAHYFAFPHDDKGVSLAFFDALAKQDPDCLCFGVQNQKKERLRILHRFNGERPEETIAASATKVLLYHSFLRLVGRQNLRRE